MPIQHINRTITQIAIDQSTPTTTDLIAAPGAGLKIYVVTLSISLGGTPGTIKFQEGTGPTDLTGEIDFPAQGGLVAVGNGIDPVIQTNTANAKFSIVSTGSAANGWLRYFVAA